MPGSGVQISTLADKCDVHAIWKLPKVTAEQVSGIIEQVAALKSARDLTTILADNAVVARMILDNREGCVLKKEPFTDGPLAGVEVRLNLDEMGDLGRKLRQEMRDAEQRIGKPIRSKAIEGKLQALVNSLG